MKELFYIKTYFFIYLFNNQSVNRKIRPNVQWKKLFKNIFNKKHIKKYIKIYNLLQVYAIYKIHVHSLTYKSINQSMTLFELGTGVFFSAVFFPLKFAMGIDLLSRLVHLSVQIYAVYIAIRKKSNPIGARSPSPVVLHIKRARFSSGKWRSESAGSLINTALSIAASIPMMIHVITTCAKALIKPRTIPIFDTVLYHAYALLSTAFYRHWHTLTYVAFGS